jgi:hypothetical protein
MRKQRGMWKKQRGTNVEQDEERHEDRVADVAADLHFLFVGRLDSNQRPTDYESSPNKEAR